ncbi:MAG: hypothetical protein WA738_07220 [Candidatus Angelobacter sp.]
MNKFLSALAVVIIIAAVGVLRPANGAQPVVMAATPLLQQSSACTFPTQMAATPEQTAWQLFVAATCPVGTQYPYVAWEQWTEQNQIYGSSAQMAEGKRPRFHMSPLARIMREKARHKKGRLKAEQILPQSANEDCNSQTWSKRTICEEARLNPDAQKYVQSNNLNTLAGQEQFVKAGTAFQFTPPSIEIKADWIQLASCNNPPQNVHVETVDGRCYALGGIHLISKLIDKWVWATFEPQNSVTNPQRCKVLGCNDPWGSQPAKSSGATTQLTSDLAALMKQADLAPEWLNYRLDGVQVDFVDAKGKPTILGNSIIEGDNAGNPSLMKQSSCITCHDLSTINVQGQQLSPNFIVGPPANIPAGYVRRDFVWSLSLAQ